MKTWGRSRERHRERERETQRERERESERESERENNKRETMSGPVLLDFSAAPSHYALLI